MIEIKKSPQIRNMPVYFEISICSYSDWTALQIVFLVIVAAKS